MGQVTITLNGRSYRLRCGDGEEARLIALAEHVEGKLSGLVAEFGQVGDERLLVMAAIMVADELFDARQALTLATEGRDPSLTAADPPPATPADPVASPPAGAVAASTPPRTTVPPPMEERPDDPPIKRAMRRNEATRRTQ